MNSQDQVIQILIVDDHEIVRFGLSTALASYPDLQVIGQAANGQEAIDFCARLQPNLILMDLSMPIMDGIEATRIICGQYPHIKIVILTNSFAHSRKQEALKAGASQYLTKGMRVEAISAALRAVTQ
jgi:DNA-binding NarL/FixJ family response regulator